MFDVSPDLTIVETGFKQSPNGAPQLDDRLIVIISLILFKSLSHLLNNPNWTQ